MANAFPEGGAHHNQMRSLANAIQVLANTVNSENPHINIAQFVDACRLFLFTKFGFGLPFIIADLEIQSKVNELANRTNIGDTIKSTLDREIAAGTAHGGNSACRNIVRFKRVIEAFMVAIEQILANEGTDSLSEGMEIAYRQVFAEYHGPSSRETFAGLRPLFPTFSRVLIELNENENSVKEPLNQYVAASRVVINYIQSVLESNEASAELLGLI